ncbi:MAG TPA: nucleotide exchange factor GrpE [Thermoplasmata archaeon]|nr:nucleotide exchange factor GrpE [Thermoplasmata archaeon]
MTDGEPEPSGKADEPSTNQEEPTPAAPVTATAEDWATRFKYLFADFENYRRRTERERQTMTRQVRAGMLRELLPILEGFQTAEEALDHLPPSDPVRKGLEILDREWMTFLKHEGVEPVAAVGQPFRAEDAEAVGETAASSDHPAGTIAEVVQQGYRFYGGLLRPAKVVVARDRSGPSTASPSVAPERSSEES